MRFIAILPLFALLAHAQPFSQSDPVFSQNNSPLLLGCVGAWRLEEASGTRYDCSLYGNHLTSNNSVSSSGGKVGNCSKFVGASNQYLSINDNASLHLNDSDFTFAAWVMIIGKSTNINILDKDNGTTKRDWLFLHRGVNDRMSFFAFKAGPTSVIVTNTSFGSPATNTWFFTVCQHDSAAQTITIQSNNGPVDSISVGAALVNTSDMEMRVGANGAGNTFANAYIDELGIWKRKLTAAELTFLYNSTKGTHFPWAHP